jgi:SH3-like domain-containing protein
MRKLFTIFFFLFITAGYADDSFISIRSDEVNVRNGPSAEYPIKFTYQIRNMPLKLLGEYDNWYKITDKDNDEGWINKNLATKKRYLIVINGTQIVYKDDNVDSAPIFRVEENVVVEHKKCSNEWCKVGVDGKTGWIQAENVWGY